MQKEHDDPFTHTCGCSECGEGTIDFIDEIANDITSTDQAEEIGRRLWRDIPPHLHASFLKGFINV